MNTQAVLLPVRHKAYVAVAMSAPLLNLGPFYGFEWSIRLSDWNRSIKASYTAIVTDLV